MSVKVQVQDSAVCVRCRVHTNQEKYLYLSSSSFRFQNCEWSLSYNYHSGLTRHILALHIQSKGVHVSPFDVCVQLEMSGGEHLSRQICFPGQFGDYGAFEILVAQEEEILKAIPGFRRFGSHVYGILPFLVVLTLKGDFSPADLPSTSCNSTQTMSNVSCLESLSKDFSKLMEHDSKTDIEFQCAGQFTKAHEAVVSARSKVIASMLESDMIEGKTKIVKIPNMEPDIFQKFLRYLYTGQLDELTFEVALKLFEAADQYAVSGLVKRCSQYLAQHLSAQNACETLVIADAHSNEGLVEKVIDYMVEKRVPLTSEVWPAFCDEHSRLATKVLNRGWKVLVK